MVHLLEKRDNKFEPSGFPKDPELYSFFPISCSSVQEDREYDYSVVRAPCCVYLCPNSPQ